MESCPDKPTTYWQNSQVKNYIAAPDLLSNLDRRGAPELSGSKLATTASISRENPAARCSPGKASKLRAQGLVPAEER